MYSRKTKDVTAHKSATISALELKIDRQSTLVAQAQGKYESLETKLTTFRSLLTQAEKGYTAAQANYDQYLAVEAAVQETRSGAGSSSEVSQSSFALAKTMLGQWQDVAGQALEAATQIAEVADYIQGRKASNPLISDRLVQEANQAHQQGLVAVKAVVSALTEAMHALSTASEASQSTSLTVTYSEMANSLVLGAPQSTDGNGDSSKESPLSQLVQIAREQARRQVEQYQNAVAQIQQNASEAKLDFSKAQEELASLKKALSAAKVAVGRGPAAQPAPAPAA
ncbi:MAG: hypothetical protein AAFQ98_20215 [Bacteroidota bacterium]